MLPSEFLETRELCKRYGYMTNGQLQTLPEGSDACCLIGATYAALKDDRYALIRFEDELRAVIGTQRLIAWNDRPETTKEMALAALRETERRLGMA